VSSTTRQRTSCKRAIHFKSCEDLERPFMV
jgi:hypothetical protein